MNKKLKKLKDLGYLEGSDFKEIRDRLKEIEKEQEKEQINLKNQILNMPDFKFVIIS